VIMYGVNVMHLCGAMMCMCDSDVTLVTVAVPVQYNYVHALLTNP